MRPARVAQYVVVHDAEVRGEHGDANTVFVSQQHRLAVVGAVPRHGGFVQFPVRGFRGRIADVVLSVYAHDFGNVEEHGAFGDEPLCVELEVHEDGPSGHDGTPDDVAYGDASVVVLARDKLAVQRGNGLIVNISEEALGEVGGANFFFFFWIYDPRRIGRA